MSPTLYPRMLTMTCSPSFSVGSIESPFIVYDLATKLTITHTSNKPTAMATIHSTISFFNLTPPLLIKLIGKFFKRIILKLTSPTISSLSINPYVLESLCLSPLSFKIKYEFGRIISPSESCKSLIAKLLISLF